MQSTYRVHEEDTSNLHKDDNPELTGYKDKNN